VGSPLAVGFPLGVGAVRCSRAAVKRTVSVVCCSVLDAQALGLAKLDTSADCA